MKKQRLSLFCLLIAFLFTFTACIEKELDFDSIRSPDWNSEWALPLINSEMGINDLLNDSVEDILEGENGLISIVYESEQLVSVEASEIAEIPDQETDISEVFDLPLIPAGIEGVVPVQFKITFKLDEENLRVDSILLKNGMYNFRLNTNLDKDITSIDFVIPNLISNQTGYPLQFTQDIDTQNGGIIEKDTTFDLSTFKIVIENSLADTNQIYINGLIHFISDGEEPNNPYYIELENEFINMEFNKFFGYGGYRVISMTDTIKLDIFDVNQEGNFTFGEGSVNLNIDVKNSFGLPVLLDITTFRAYHGTDDQDSMDIFIFGEGIPSEIELNYPSLAQVGEIAETFVNTDNSNMNEALSISPNKLFIAIDGLLNHDEDLSSTNFIIDTSNISVELMAEIKLFGSANSFKIVDTLDFELDNIDELDKLAFAVNIENGFPINADIGVAFTDSLYNVKHQLLTGDNRLMTAGQVGSPPEYRVTGPAIKNTEIILTHEQIQKVADSEKILVTAVLSTDQNELVKIYADYLLRLKLGAKIGIKL